MLKKPVVEGLLTSSWLSPSAANRQEWKFIVVRDTKKRKKLAEATCGQSLVSQAPVVRVACATARFVSPPSWLGVLLQSRVTGGRYGLLVSGRDV
jgi:nitroreductase